jgi:hypothetical protein
LPPKNPTNPYDNPQQQVTSGNDATTASATTASRRIFELEAWNLIVSTSSIVPGGTSGNNRNSTGADGGHSLD